MSKSLCLLAASLAVLAFPQKALAGPNDTLACSISVEYRLNSTVALTFVRDFTVSPTAPYSENWSTPTRFRFFDASVTDVAGTPVVSIIWDADVSVFNTVDFGAQLKVRNPSSGETTSGDQAFFTSGPTGGTAHRTSYSLTCARARN